MSLWKIAWRSVQRRLLASVLTSLSMALGVMLVVTVLLMVGVVDDSFRSNSSLGYNMIVGAKGGKLQLVLNTVYYLSQPVENLPFNYYQEFLSADARSPDLGATMGSDYGSSIEYFDGTTWQPSAGSVEFAIGETSLQVRVPVFADTVKEKAEDFSLAVEVATAHRTVNRKVVGIGTITDTPVPIIPKSGASESDRESEETASNGTDSDGTKADATEDHELVKEATPVPEELPKLSIENAFASDQSDTHAVFTLELSKPCDDVVAMNLSLSDGRDGRYAAYVEKAVPVCLGDYFENYRVIGTTPELFNFVYNTEEKLTYEFASGRVFEENSSEHGYFEAVLGAKVARETGLQVGQTLQPAHGSPGGKAHDDFHIVGILASSGTPQDRAVFVNMGGFNRIRDHVREDGSTEITSLLVKTKSPLHSAWLRNELNEGLQAQAVLPTMEIFKLFDLIVKPIRSLLLLISAMICVVSGVSILVSIYNSMSDRRQEIAVMRSLGAGRGTVMTVVLLESVILALAGGIFGWLSGHALIGMASSSIEERTGVVVSPFDLTPPIDLTGLLGDGLSPKISTELLLVPALIILAIIVGFLPALSAYRTDVAKALQSSP